jgi:hypothetical protein
MRGGEPGQADCQSAIMLEFMRPTDDTPLVSVCEFEALHDAAAIMQCGEWRSINPMELWSGRRKVMRWDEVTGSKFSRCRPVSAFWKLA